MSAVCRACGCVRHPAASGLWVCPHCDHPHRCDKAHAPCAQFASWLGVDGGAGRAT